MQHASASSTLASGSSTDASADSSLILEVSEGVSAAEEGCPLLSEMSTATSGYAAVSAQSSSSLYDGAQASPSIALPICTVGHALLPSDTSGSSPAVAADAASSPSLALGLTEHALPSPQEALALVSTQNAASVHRCAGFAFVVLAPELLHFLQDVPYVLCSSEVPQGGNTTG